MQIEQRRPVIGAERDELAENFPAAQRLLRQQSEIVGERRRGRGADFCSSLVTSVMVASGVPSSCAAAAASPSSCERCCSRSSTSSVAASAVDELPRFVGDARGVEADEGGAERQRRPDAGAIEQREMQLRALVPGQRQDIRR